MTKTKAPLNLVTFDAAKYLDDDEAVAEYMTAVLETHDPDLLLLALGDVARAKGMTQVARDAGLGRESLYKALAPGAKPRFETVMRVAKALGVKFTAQVSQEAAGDCQVRQSPLFKNMGVTARQCGRQAQYVPHASSLCIFKAWAAAQGCTRARLVQRRGLSLCDTSNPSAT